jgi:hypothetical protein
MMEMDNHGFSVAVLRLLTDTVKKLKADQVDQLVEGKAKLAFVPPGAMVVFPGPDATEVRSRLASAASRQDAAQYLASLKLKKADLVSLATQLEIAFVSKDTMPVIQRKIVEATAGVREDHSAIRDRSRGR